MTYLTATDARNIARQPYDRYYDEAFRLRMPQG